MCGRYSYNKKTEDDIRRIATPYTPGEASVAGEDICPSMQAVVIFGKDGGLYTGKMTWGFPGIDGKLLINARAESALDKRSFKDHVAKRRCVIPASHFYEWDHHKNKVQFYNHGEKTLFMAGIYNEQGHFVILTTAANDSMIQVHERMPLILPEDQVYSWVFAGDSAGTFLEMKSPMLISKQDYEQLSFDRLFRR